MFDLSKQIIGFGGSAHLRTLWDIAKDFTPPVTEESFIALLEQTLADRLASYGLGLKWVTVHGDYESARLVHLYRKTE